MLCNMLRHVKHTSPRPEEHSFPGIKEFMCHQGGNDYKIEQVLDIYSETVEKVKMNVESLICILCKLMFPGGTYIQDFFTHLKDDHGIIHNHLHILECSKVSVTSKPLSEIKIEEPKSVEMKKRIRGC